MGSRHEEAIHESRSTSHCEGSNYETQFAANAAKPSEGREALMAHLMVSVDLDKAGDCLKRTTYSSNRGKQAGGETFGGMAA
jgi:hypothetical protein